MRDQSYRVGEWLVSAADNKLVRGDRVLVVEPRLVDMLCYFSTHPGEVLSRDELIDNIWTRNIVTPHVVTQCISELRKSLKDGRADAPEYIMTVPKRGYRLVAPVTLCMPYDRLDSRFEHSVEPNSAAHAPNILDTRDLLTIPLSSVNMTSEMMFGLPHDKTEHTEQTQNPSVTGDATLATHGHYAPTFATTNGADRVSESQTMAVLTKTEDVTASAHSSTRWRTAFIALFLAILAGISLYFLSPTRQNAPLLMNPNDIEIQWVANKETPCADSQEAIGSVNGLLSQALNNYSVYTAHDMTNYIGHGLPTAGKTIYAQFEHLQHHSATQCFLAISLVNNATKKTLMSKRYIITETNLLTVQIDVINHVFAVLGLSPPVGLLDRLSQVAPQDGGALRQYYHAHRLLQNGDINSLLSARELLQSLLKRYPNFVYAQAELLLNNMVLMTLQPAKNYTELRHDFKQQLTALTNNPALQGNPILLQLQALFQLINGNLAMAQTYAEQAVRLEKNWLSYVILGKVYELEGLFSDASDAYLSAYSQQPGPGTYYWIKYAIFQSDLNAVAFYLNNESYE
ncbi:MAG: lysine decarboxylation/transport transcriptional activator CadC [Plesiomonas sp.]|uniref:lysine decarboxylation/transport transcriptional activator CadC n=1 Tax=Plesiomonas sp. TaxID=2486279 RepID=UPI003F2C7645